MWIRQDVQLALPSISFSLSLSLSLSPVLLFPTRKQSISNPEYNNNNSEIIIIQFWMKRQERHFLLSSYFLRRVLAKTAVRRLPTLECGERRPPPESSNRLNEDLLGISSGETSFDGGCKLDLRVTFWPPPQYWARFSSPSTEDPDEQLVGDSTRCSWTFNRKLTERLNSLAVRNGLVLELSGEEGVDRVTSAHPSLNVFGIWRYFSFLGVLVPFEAIPKRDTRNTCSSSRSRECNTQERTAKQLSKD